MNFILGQQAESSARLAGIEVVMGRLVEPGYYLEQNLAKLAESLTATNQSFAENNRSVSASRSLRPRRMRG